MTGRPLVALASISILAAACGGGVETGATSSGAGQIGATSSTSTSTSSSGGASRATGATSSVGASRATGATSSTAGPSTGSSTGQSTGQTEPGPAERPCVMQRVPEAAGLDPFYTKGCRVDGFWVVANEVVAHAAVLLAGDTVAAIFATDPDLADAIASFGIRLGVIGADQRLTEMPEYRDLYEVFPDTDWDNRARGLGATAERPLVSVGEENLLCLPSDRYLGEDILLHEFAHVIDEQGFSVIDPLFVTALSEAYGRAVDDGTWADTYAAENPYEYWAEGVQSFFGRNLTADPADGIHGPIDTESELAAADPALHALIDGRLGGLDLPPSCSDQGGS